MLIVLAIIPGIIFLECVWKLDKVEKEPARLLFFLVCMGVLSIIPTMLLESIADDLEGIFLTEGTTLYLIIDNFIAVALIEEFCKFVFLKIGSWKSKDFNYLFDGIIYSVCVGMGFAVLENIMYVIDGGLSIAILRGIMSVPGHGAYAIIMGHYYSMARFQQNKGNTTLAKKWLRKAVIIPTLFHGFYDFCISADSLLLVLVVITGEAFLYYACYKNIRKYSKNDSEITA